MRQPQRALLALGLLGLLCAVWPGLLRAQTNERCFPETGQCINGRIREFWEQNGGLAVFGYPITPQREEVIEGRGIQVQWFERERLELHPQNARPYDVLLGRLGADRLAQQSRNWFQFQREGARQGCQYFAETGQNVCGRILETWRANGLEFDGQRGASFAESLALFGLPLSPLQTETLSDGRAYQVQWFERARFELHPENAAPFDVLLGLLGNEVLRGLTSPTTPATPTPAPGTPTPTPTPAPGTPPDTVDYDEPERLACDDLADDEIFRPDTSDVELGTFDIPAEIPLCVRGFPARVELEIEVRKPDGDRDRRRVTTNAEGEAAWFYARTTGNQLGNYDVLVRRGGEAQADGEFRMTRTPESEPKVLVLPRSDDPGSTFEVHIGGLAANSEVTLHLYRRCNQARGCYVESLLPVRANADGQAEAELTTDPDDPEDSYQIGFFRSSDRGSFIYDVFELND